MLLEKTKGSQSQPLGQIAIVNPFFVPGLPLRPEPQSDGKSHCEHFEQDQPDRSREEQHLSDSNAHCDSREQEQACGRTVRNADGSARAS